MNSILLVLSNKDNYYRFKDNIKEHTLTKEINIIIKDIEHYFKEFDTHEEVNWDIFSTWFKTIRHTSYSSDKLKIFDKIFTNLDETELDEDDILPIVESYISKDYATKMADYLLSIVHGDDTKSITELYQMLGEYEEESHAIQDDEFLVNGSWDELWDDARGSGLQWRSQWLDKSMGDLRQGDFIVVAARPDSGKTSFLASESGFMAQQMKDDECVLWFNNEEGGNKVRRRLWTATLDKDADYVKLNSTVSRGEIEKLWGGDLLRVKIISKADMSVTDVERELKRYNPKLIIFDQLHKIYGFKDAFSETDHMTKLYGWARAIAQKHAPVINVHQASTDAAGQKYIEMHQLYASKTGIQGEADAMITIGRSLDPADPPNTRYMYVPKNKMDGKDPAYRNGKFEVEINPLTGRFYD